MKLNLVVMTPGKSEGKAIPITLSQFLVGRDPQCHLRPASASISKRHCAILVRDGKVYVRDFDSTNGTFVNDEPVKGEVELHDKDRLKIGPLLFGVQIETKSKVSRATTPPPATKQTPAPPSKPTESVDEESVGAWLLSMQDEGTPTPGVGEEVPDGSTVVMEKPPEPENKDAEGADAPAAGKGKAVDNSANTADAARAILQKYMRRPRG
jgi:predicted component of type VI protein secretion system